MPKFKILPKVQSFMDAEGTRYTPGDIVELPLSYLGESWLEPVEKPKKPTVPPARAEPVAAEKPVPFEAPKKSRKTK